MAPVEIALHNALAFFVYLLWFASCYFAYYLKLLLTYLSFAKLQMLSIFFYNLDAHMCHNGYELCISRKLNRLWLFFALI